MTALAKGFMNTVKDSTYPPLGRSGNLEVRLADPCEVEAAQALRHRVFRGAAGLDSDRFDVACDHLIVVDGTAVVATYRLLPQDRAGDVGGFYTGSEFAVEDLVSRYPGLRFLELGRSCVAQTHRTKRVMELLWHGTWAYVLRGGFDVLMGCASFPGTDARRHDPALGYLRRHARAEAGWRVRAAPGRGIALPRSVDNERAALRALPPLLRGYLRLGAEIGEEAVIDADFGTTDVLVLLRRARISQRWIDHYGAGAERYAT